MIKLPTVDYSPALNALERAGQAQKAILSGKAANINKRQLQLQQDQTIAGAVSGAVSGLLDVGKEVYSIFEQGALEKTKAQLQTTQQEMKQRIRDLALSGAIQPGADGSIEIPADFERYYQEKVKEIDAGLGDFKSVRTWAKDSLYSIYDSLTETALNAAQERALKERDTLHAQNLATALKESVASGDFSKVQETISGAAWLGADAKAAITQQAQQQWDLGVKDRQVRAMTTDFGFAKADEYIQGLVKTGLSSENADALRNAAQYESKVAELKWIDKGIQGFQTMLATGATGETAIANVYAQTPQAYQPSVRQALQVEFKRQLDETDRVADEEVGKFYFENKGNPYALQKLLLDPEKKYDSKMIRGTQMYWWGVAQQDIAAIERGEKKPVSDQATLALMKRYFISNMPDQEFMRVLKSSEVSADGTVLLQNDDIMKFSSTLAQRKNFTDKRILDQEKRISDFYDSNRKGKTDPKKLDAILKEELETQNSFINMLANHWDEEGYLETLSKKVDSLLGGVKSKEITDAMIPKFDPYNLDDAKSGAADLLLSMQNHEIDRSSSKEAATAYTQIDSWSKQTLARKFGITEVLQEAIDSDPNGGDDLPMYLINGTDGVPHWYKVMADPEDKKIKVYEVAGGADRAHGLRWDPATTLPNNAKKAAKAEHDSALAASEALEKPKTEAAKADPNSDLFYQEIYAEARKRLVDVAVDKKVPSPTQAQQGMTVQVTPRAPTKADKESVAKEMAPKLLQMWHAVGGNWTKQDLEDAEYRLLTSAFTEDR